MSASTEGLTGLTGWVADVVSALGPTGVGLLVAVESIFPPIPSEVVLPVAGFRRQPGAHASAVGARRRQCRLARRGVGPVLARGAGGCDRLRRWADRMPLMDVSDVDRAEGWFARHGGKAVLIGRCVPVVRSLVSIPAGVERMLLWRFTLYTLVGSAVWNGALVLGGYALGSRFGEIGRYSDYINYTVYALIAFFVLRFVTRRRRQRWS